MELQRPTEQVTQNYRQRKEHQKLAAPASGRGYTLSYIANIDVKYSIFTETHKRINLEKK